MEQALLFGLDDYILDYSFVLLPHNVQLSLRELIHVFQFPIPCLIFEFFWLKVLRSDIFTDHLECHELPTKVNQSDITSERNTTDSETD